MFEMVGHTKKNDDAVSPVIGTILMVALVVILAAVIGAIVFGLAGNLHKTKIVAVTASRAADGITLTYDGGQDASQVSNLSLIIDGNLVGKTTETPAVGTSWPVPIDYAGTYHVTVIGEFIDGSEQVILDTNVYSGNLTSTTATVTPTPTVGTPLILSNVSSWPWAPYVGVICNKQIASASVDGFTLNGGESNNLEGTAWLSSYGGGFNNVLVLDMTPEWNITGPPLKLSYMPGTTPILAQDGGGALAGFTSETVRLVGT